MAAATRRKSTSAPQLRRFSIFTTDQQRRESIGYDNQAFSVDGLPPERWRYGGTKDAVTDMNLGLDTGYTRRYSVALKTLKPFRPHSKDGKIPVNKAGLFSYLFVSWISSLVWKIFRKRKQQLDEDDIWECSEHEMSKPNTNRMKRLWDEELEKRGPDKASMLRVWFTFTRTRMFVTLIVVSINAVATFIVSGYMLELIIAYLESTENDLLYGLGLVLAMLACNIIRATTFCFIILFGVQTGIRFRAGYLGLAYHKLLKLKSLKGKTLAEMITLYGSDGYRVYLLCAVFVYILALPVYLIIGTVYTYYLLGPWCFIAVAVFLLCYQLQGWLTRVVASFRRNVLIYTDKRVRKMTEVLNSMKLIKMYAWESSFKSSVEELRKKEKHYLHMSAIINSISAAIIPVTPTLASVATIATYRAVGNELSASVAFAVVGTLNFLRVIVAMMPFASRTLGEANVSFQRMKKLLLLEEFEPPGSDCNDETNAIEIMGATFIWEQSALDHLSRKDLKKAKKDAKEKGEVLKQSMDVRHSIQLNSLNLAVKKGKLVGICGAVGSGKSSLLSAMMGRMPMRSGHLAVVGSVAYAAQQAWIFNGTLRENILFGKEYDLQRYQNTIYVCGLEPDLAILVDGDETEIGDRGTNLSGGQKQRVSLARAVYSNSDLYLLDDPLSAVDVHVGRHLFHKCIQKTLKGKTVILATHQLQYLKHCDEIWVMEDGNIVERGDHDSLIKLSGYYGNMMAQFHATTVTPAANQGKDVTANAETKTEKTLLAANDDQRAKPIVSSLPAKQGVETGDLTKRRQSKVKLTETEEVQAGDVGFGTYRSYINAAGGWIITCLVLMCYIAALGSVVFSDWWLGIWINSMDVSSTNGVPQMNTTQSLKGSWMTPASYNDSNQTTNVPFQATTGPSINNGTTEMLDTGGSVFDIYLIVYVASLGGIIILTLIKGFVGATATVNASNNIHSKALQNIMKAPMKFFDSNPSGRILNRFSKDLDEGDVFLPQLLDSFLQIFFNVFLSILTNAIVLPWMLLALLPVTILYGILKAVSAVSVRQLKRLENVARSPMISHVNTSAQGLETIVTFKQQRNFFETNFNRVDVTSTANFLFEASMRWIGLRLDLTSALITLATSLALVLTKGTISAALGGLALTMCIRVVSVMQFMIRLMNEVEARFTSIERLHQYEKKVESELDEGEVFPGEYWPNDGKVIFSNVVMKYRDDMEPVLQNINFEIKAQEKVGVVGRTGAGKSSLAAALFRLVDLTSGHIYIDGVDVSHISLYNLRSKLSTIPQDPVLFAGSMRYNLDPFNRYTDDEIWESLEKVHMKEKVILFDNQLEHQIEENGGNFSVGERQLICLARAILRRNKILLLDEATASIDTATDAMIQQTIRDSFTDCTVITIAHRLNTVLHCDKIMIMDEGKVIEIGKPQDLLVNPHSHFNTMFAAQTIKTPSP